MNTFTFTDDEVKRLILLIDSAKGHETGSPFLAIKEKLERKPSYITGECGGPEIPTAQALAMREAGKELFYTGGKVNIAMPSFDHRGNIKLNPKEK